LKRFKRDPGAAATHALPTASLIMHRQRGRDYLRRQNLQLDLLGGPRRCAGPRPQEQDAERVRVLGAQQAGWCPKDLLTEVESAWTRYRECVEKLLETGVTEENRDAVAIALRRHRDASPISADSLWYRVE
jgi:hypothetical protein